MWRPRISIRESLRQASPAHGCGADEDAWKLADAIGASWAAFAATGDPTNDRTGPWSRHDPANRRTMVLGREIGDAPNPVPVPEEAA